MYSVYCVW